MHGLSSPVSGDAGILSVEKLNWISETALESAEIAANITEENCAVWVDRHGITYGVNSGLAGIRVEVSNCAEGDFPEVRDQATYLRDFLYARQTAPLQWADGESGRKCLVGILTQEAVEAIIFQGYEPPPSVAWIWINAAAWQNRDSNCGWFRYFMGPSALFYFVQLGSTSPYSLTSGFLGPPDRMESTRGTRAFVGRSPGLTVRPNCRGTASR